MTRSSSPLPDPIDRLFAVFDPVNDAAEFESLVQSEPWVAADPMLGHLRELMEAPELGAAVAPILELLEGAREDPARAWTVYEARVAEFEAAADGLAPALEEIDRLVEAGEWDTTIKLASQSLPVAERAGLAIMVGRLRGALGISLIQTGSGNHAENVEAAGDLLESAAGLATEPVSRAYALMQLAWAWRARVTGDPAETVGKAVLILRDALAEIEGEGEPRLETTIQTNLAEVLQTHEAGDRLANLTEARELCLKALDWRSPARNPDDWAYTVLNLGATLEMLADLGVLSYDDPAEAYALVLAQTDRLVEASLVAHAYAGAGRVLRAKAQPDELGDEPDQQLMRDASDHFVQALKCVEQGDDRILYGRILNQLAEASEVLGEKGSAADASRRALAAVPPTVSPPQAHDAACRLGGLMADQGRWDEAADAFRIALVAAEFAFRARIELADRRGELRKAGNLSRWGAYAIARSGDTEEAVRVLDGGRTRELAERLEQQAEPDLENLPPELVTGRPLGPPVIPPPPTPSTPGIVPSPDDVLRQIRGLPGLENFAVGTPRERIAEAIEPGWPLVFIDPAPQGTFIALVQADGDGDGEVEIDPLFLKNPTSREVLLRLAFGDYQNPASSDSYVGTASDLTPGRRLDRALDFILPWLGENLVRPIATRLEEAGARGVSLVLSGPLGLAPLHAASWTEAGNHVTLLDKFPVRYAPSATMLAACLAKTRRAPSSARLLALGNPAGAGLPAAEVEVAELARCFESGRAAPGLSRARRSARVWRQRDHPRRPSYRGRGAA